MTSDKLSRITEWWRPKAGTIFSLLLFYLALWDVPYNEGWKLLLYSVITLSGFGITAYFFNDWADVPFDRKVGKTNLVADIHIGLRLLIFCVLLVITLFPWFFFFAVDALSVALISLQFILMVVYPIPPVRLKNHPRIAMVTDSLYAFAIPSVLAWHTFDLTVSRGYNTGEYLHFVFLAIWMLMVGLRQITAHHVMDAENDRVAGTPNLALEISPLKLRTFLERITIPIELIAALLFFLNLLKHTGLLPIVPLGVIILLGASLLLQERVGFFTSFHGNYLDNFNSFWLGIISGMVLLQTDMAYLIVLFFFIVLFRGVLSHPVWSILMKSIATRAKRYLVFPFQFLSLAFNWALYYFRKWVLNWNEERNWGKHYQNRLNDLALQARKERGIIAVFNQNHNKYTETFVKGHIGQLPFHTIPFHGWPSMIHTGNMENLVANHLYLQKARYAWWQLMDKNARNREDSLIAQRLIQENVDVILAEFGTVGARLVEVSKQTGIPLITIFYGYDAWNSDVLTENKDAYRQLFGQACAVIGVSRDICNQLKVLGCVPEKIIYLPCFVNLELFKPVERDFSRKILLAVGRFCVTKAPSLTILAFNEVLKAHPNAELRMIGEDDGNGVLESCLTLVNALGIVDSVKFLGSKGSEGVAEEMFSASIFVQHSVTAPKTGDKEGTPVAIMEAMACGLPVVSTKHAGIQEIIVDGETGILVDEFDYLRMAEGISDLLNDTARMKKMGSDASTSIRANRSVADHIGMLSEIIERHK